MDSERLVGDYILGPRIGSGSFAVVWRASHRNSGFVVAVKEIDKKVLSPKVRDNLLKEISILSTIEHSNIIRLYETIETKDRIYLVLEYCDGGDLAEYIHKHGKVSEPVAKLFMRQLATGLQVLQEKHLIHRDLKPQNLLLSSDEANPLLKIGDFGFARSLTLDDMASTLCGSPLYMAPEIIQNQKYDSKADLWSVGAILFQLVTGKPPFEGNNHIQLFQNVLSSKELQFPRCALEELHEDCVDLCRRLLRRNPVERLTFREFFDHKFLQEPREIMKVVQTAQTRPLKVPIEQSESSTSLRCTTSREAQETATAELHNIDKCGSSSFKNPHDKIKKSEEGQCSSYPTIVVDSMEFIEREYVLVNPHSASIENLYYDLDTPVQDTRRPNCAANQNKPPRLEPPVERQISAPSCSSLSESSKTQSRLSQHSSSGTYVVREVHKLTVICPPSRLKLLQDHVKVLAEVAQDQYNAGQIRESFSIELVILAVWKKALEICDGWMKTAGDAPSAGISEEVKPTANYEEGQGLNTQTGQSVEFTSPSSAKIWVTQEFVGACNRAEQLSNHLNETEGTQMPDSMDILYERALAFGKNGGVDEYMNNKTNAATLYTKAIVLLSFIVEEAVTLPLNPPFTLTPLDKKRIQSYITNLQFRHSHL